jgi:hypothetical protein
MAIGVNREPANCQTKGASSDDKRLKQARGHQATMTAFQELSALDSRRRDRPDNF